MGDESKRQRRLDEEELARLRKQTHGVIDGKPAALPLAPEPTMVGVVAAVGKARRAADAPREVDDQATVPVQLVGAESLSRDSTPTPPPLPPSPASHAAEVWLEEAVTRPSAFADLASSVGGPAGISAPGVGNPATLDPVAEMREAHAQALRSMRIILILSSAIAFTVGLVLGGLLFR